MPRFDFKCPQCNTVRHDVYIPTADVLSTHVVCERCVAIMDKLPSAPNFTIKGYNAQNGYNK